jgi:hypothetical protein
MKEVERKEAEGAVRGGMVVESTVEAFHEHSNAPI